MKVTFGDIDFGDPRETQQFIEALQREFGRIRLDDQIIIGGGTPIKKHLSVTGTWDPGNAAAGAQVTTTIALAGAALGDEVTCSFSLDLALLQLTGYVSSADTITVLLANHTAGGINLGSGTLRVSVWQH